MKSTLCILCLLLAFALLLIPLSSLTAETEASGRIHFSAKEGGLFPASLSFSLPPFSLPTDKLFSFLPFFATDGIAVMQAEVGGLFSLLFRLCE